MSTNQPDKETPLALRLADAIHCSDDQCKCSRNEAAAELRRLYQHEQATSVWSEKTEWVQKTAKPGELGMHRADALKKRIDDLTALNAELVEVLSEIMSWEENEEMVWAERANAALAKAKGESNEQTTDRTC